MNEENFEKFKNRNKKNKFKNENGRKRNKRERRNARYQGKTLINDLISESGIEYNKKNHDDKH